LELRRLLLRQCSSLLPPTPRSRRHPARLLLPAGTARCLPRNCLSRNPFHPPLGESCVGPWPAVPAESGEEPPRPRAVVIVLPQRCQAFCNSHNKTALMERQFTKRASAARTVAAARYRRERL